MSPQRAPRSAKTLAGASPRGLSTGAPTEAPGEPTGVPLTYRQAISQGLPPERVRDLLAGLSGQAMTGDRQAVGALCQILKALVPVCELETPTEQGGPAQILQVSFALDTPDSGVPS